MTSPAPDLTTRLLSMYSHRGDGIPTQYVNPDGPEAATALTTAQSRIEELEGVLSITFEALSQVFYDWDGEHEAMFYTQTVLKRARTALTKEEGL